MSPQRRRALLIAFATALAVLLITATTASAAAGGGTFNFGGGGGHGGGFSGGGGSGRGHSAFEIYLILRLVIDIARLGHGLGLLILIGLALAVWFMRSGLPKMQAAAEARRQQGRTQSRRTRRRERRVELAAAEAADDQPGFDPEQIRETAAVLFTDIQMAWDAGDRIRLRGLIAPQLLAEWERRLDEFDRQGWRNRVEPLGPPDVHYVGLSHTTGEDRVTVRIEARMRDFVTDRTGRHIKRRGQFTETVRLREYWTLERRDDHWILSSIESGAEGAHRLDEQLRPTAWSDDQALKDEALVEQAVADAPPDHVKTAELADLDFAGDARAAANDLSLADGRFAPDILAVAARRAVAAWLEAIDGSDTQLRKLAAASAVDYLLHPGDPSHRTRLVLRGAQVQRIEIAALDPAAEPPAMTIDVHLRGRRYLQDRGTTQVLAGDPAREVAFTERWTLVLTDDPEQPWRIMFVSSPAQAV